MAYSRYLKKKKLKKNKQGQTLCRYCESPVKYPRKTLCSEECSHQYRLRTHGPYLRGCVLKRDKGVCANCGVDTLSLKKQSKQILKDYGKETYWMFAKSMGFDPKRKTFWDVDHILEVSKGGGACGLDNVCTLCIPCHKIKTAKFMKKRYK